MGLSLCKCLTCGCWSDACECDLRNRRWDLSKSKPLLPIDCNLDVFSEVRENLAKNMSDKKDQLIKDAISYSLGYNTWTLDEIISRCIIFVRPNGIEEFHFDNVPLIEFHPFNSNILDNEAKMEIKYRILYEDNKC